VVDLNDIDLFHRNLELLGDLSICNADYRGAIHYYNKLRYMAEFTRNNEWKIQSLILLADTCQLMKKYAQAKKFLRKALQYVWFEQKKE
jgi:Tetratricopeptide repeat